MTRLIAVFCLVFICVMPGAAEKRGWKGTETLDETNTQEPVPPKPVDKPAVPDSSPVLDKATVNDLPPGLRSHAGFGNHGNYCGPGWSNGRWGNGSQNDVCKIGVTLLSPMDATDTLCFAHDKAYCGKDHAERDLADEKFISGLKQQKSVLQQAWKDAGCGERKFPWKKYKRFKNESGMNSKNKAKNRTDQEYVCMKIKAEQEYSEAAILAFTAKREYYKLQMAKKAAAEKAAAEKPGIVKSDPVEVTEGKKKDKSGGKGTLEPFRP